MLFSAIEVTYHNTNNTDLYRVKPSSYSVNFKDGASKEMVGSVIREVLAEEIGGSFMSFPFMFAFNG